MVNNNRGMALVVALLTSFILLALVASLFWVIASTSRQVEYAKNSAIALNLAEAGTADAIYRLNYCTGTDPVADAFPFLGSANPFGTSSLVDLPQNILTNAIFPGLIIGTNSGIRGTFPETGGVYYVGIQDNAYPDTLVAVGIYKGVRRILTISLRGNSSNGSIRQAANQGISEAFNKHAIYAYKVMATTGVYVPVNGNIVYADATSDTTFITGCTRTLIDPNLFNVPTPTITFPVLVPDDSCTDTYAGGVYYKSGVAQTFPVGVNYDPAGAGTYIFDGATVDTPTWVQDHTVEIKGNTQIKMAFKSNVAIKISGPLTFINNSFLQSDVGITLDSVTIDSSLYVLDSNVTLNNSQIRPDTNGVAAIIIYSSVGGRTVTMNTASTIDGAGKAAIIAELPTGQTLTITSDDSITRITGLIYTYATGTPRANITLASGTINGALVADGTVTLNGGTLNYNSSVFTGASSGNDIYSGFSGGRRAYVPVWQGWRLR